MLQKVLELGAGRGDVVDHEFGGDVILAGNGLEIVPSPHLWRNLLVGQGGKASIARAGIDRQ